MSPKKNFFRIEIPVYNLTFIPVSAATGLVCQRLRLGLCEVGLYSLGLCLRQSPTSGPYCIKNIP
jgi:hypothetical protein